ncbi:MAG TPA: flagellar biosynthesis protein FliO [Xanthobacteraceae bacterium]|nr:flagellar biosynthesis protein FliO [Xanthobacteraceae bacterium]
MFETLFGAEMPLAVRFFLAFLIVLGLIGAAAWAVRRFGASRLGGGALRGRQPRLAVIDYANVDARRRLILVRRDNVEHLVMIGGPTDVVVESNIVRAAPAAREVAVARPAAAAEALPRAIPLPEAASNGSGGSWPLQPEPAAAPQPRRAPRAEPVAEEAGSFTPPHAEAPPRPPRDMLSALADDLAAHPLPPVPPRPRAPAAARPLAPESRPEPRVEHRAEPRQPVPPADAEAIAAADQSLAEMAQRLEAALRKPKAAEPREAPARPASAPEPATEEEAAPPAPPPPPRPARAVEAKPARSEAKAKESKLYDTLEQEMASLLGRPNKT